MQAITSRNFSAMTREELEHGYGEALDKIEFLASENHRIYSILRNKSLTQGNKSLLINTIDHIARGKPDEDGFAYVNRDKLAVDAGCHPTTVSRNMGVLADSGLIERKHDHLAPDETKHGNPGTLLFVRAPIQTMVNLENLKLRDGGKKASYGDYTCKCGSNEFQEVKTTEVYCKGCGSMVGGKKVKKKDIVVEPEERSYVGINPSIHSQPAPELPEQEALLDEDPLEEDLEYSGPSLREEVRQDRQRLAEEGVEMYGDVIADVVEMDDGIDYSEYVEYPAPDRDCYLCRQDCWKWKTWVSYKERKMHGQWVPNCAELEEDHE